MRSKGMFMLDLLSNAVGANLILLFLFIAMTGAEPPRGSRPQGGPPPQAALFLQVTIGSPWAKVGYALLPPASANDATHFILHDDPASPSRAVFVPSLSPGCWRLAVEYQEDSRGGFDSAPLKLGIAFWLSGLSSLVAGGEVSGPRRGRIDVRWPAEAQTAPAQLKAAMFVGEKQLELDPFTVTTLDLYFQDEGQSLPADGGCAVVERDTFPRRTEP